VSVHIGFTPKSNATSFILERSPPRQRAGHEKRAGVEDDDMRHSTSARTLKGTMAAAVVLALATLATAAGAASTTNEYDPKIRPANFVGTIDNPYYPLVPGARWVYESQTPDGFERTVVEVTDEQKTVLGVATTVVHDTVSLDGTVIEDTFDWYAQDKAGNVWYFGEDTHEYENGVPVNSKGAWEAGVDDAKPGIIMQAHPRVGDVYRQEFSKGVAEDKAKVLSVTASAHVPFGSYDGDVLKTRDWNPLEPGKDEHKLYAPGVGNVLERSVKHPGERVELVEYTAP
jgi:hypothetical protein